MAFAKQLADLTGLDTETAQSQLLPFLETFKERQPLVNHLQDLLGPGAAQRGFIEAYTSHRFPAPTPAAVAASPVTATGSNTTTPDTSRAASPSISSLGNKRGTTTGKRPVKAKFPTKLPPPRKIEEDASILSGGVYRKGQSTEDDKWTYRPAAAPMSSSSSGTASKAAEPTLPQKDRNADALKATATATEAAPIAEQPPSSNSISASPFQAHENITPTPEMVRLQEAISVLTISPSAAADASSTILSSTSSSLEKGKSAEKRLKPCFCHAHRHSLHPDVPMCPSCGLILCIMACPNTSPLLSPPCPSCAKPLLPPNSPARAQLIARLTQTLDELTQARRAHVAQIRAERERNWLEKRDERSAFPDLLGGTDGGGMASVSAGAREYQARKREMDLVLGRAKRKEGEESRGGRVLRLDSKTHKLKGPKSAKKGEKGGKKKDKETVAASSSSSTAALASSSVSTKEGAAVDGKSSASKDTKDGEAEAESDAESVLSYDEMDENGPMPDPHDDGFLMHGDPPLMRTQKAGGEKNAHGCWWDDDGEEGSSEFDSGVEVLHYIPKEQRPIWSIHHHHQGQDGEDEAEEEGEEGDEYGDERAAGHHKSSIPGAAK